MTHSSDLEGKPHDSGLRALSGVAGFYRIAIDPDQIERDLGLTARAADEPDLLRAASRIGLKARWLKGLSKARLSRIPIPAIVKMRDGSFQVFGGKVGDLGYRLVDPLKRLDTYMTLDAVMEAIQPSVVLVKRQLGGAGYNPATFGFRWFLPSVWRYRKPLLNVLIASLFIQVFALITPLFFQVIVDKVLPHKGYSTLLVMVAGIAILGVFDVVLQFLRTYMLSHTTNRIDVELGRRLFHHLLRLPLSYFESRSAGQTVARVRELESIRSFLTGQGLFSAIDLVFTFVFIGVLLRYSWRLTLIVLGSIPVYALIGMMVRPPLREKVKQRFSRGAESQQFLVEAVVGVHTIKASAVEPIMQMQWEEKLAAYVTTAFGATLLGAGGQSAIQYVNKITTALLLLFGAKAVIDGDLSVGELVAFNMIANQVTAPILRLSQVWQDFQQVQISVDRLGDILNTPAEWSQPGTSALPPPRGAIELRNVTFRYRPGTPEVLRGVSLSIKPGEVIGLVGPSGSGKSTLAKILQRFYIPEAGQVSLDGLDLAHCDPAWLRSHIGVVLQESLLFNRTIHENIAFANPALPRGQVMALARLAGADEFIAKLPQGYDTLIEERGTNLSGGQRQRLAIARALASNPRILIFDEATSALDYESERIIQLNMRQIVKNRTAIIIAHRLAAVRHCDRIFGIVDGRVVETGSHDELVNRENGLYAKLWSLQTATVPA